VQGDCEKEFSTFCSLMCGDADLSVYCGTGLEIHRILPVTIHMLKSVL